MNEKIDVLAVMDADIALRRSIYDEGRGTKPIARTEQNAHNLACAIEARAAIAELIEREKQQREVLDLLCAKYIANRAHIGVHDFVSCITPGGLRCADSETGRLWLRADALARIGGA